MTTERWFDADLAVVDVETTGLKAESERIIEIAIIHMRQGEVIESWGQLVNPEKPIPEEVVKLTGISQEDVESQPKFAEIAADVRSRLEGKVVVAYNLSFDKGFIANELERAGTTWPDGPALDPLVFARQLLTDCRSKKLGAVAQHLGIELVDAHRATDDATVAGHVLYALADRLPEQLHDISELQQQWGRQQEQQMARWRNRRNTQESAEPVVEAAKTPPATSDEDVALGPAYLYGNEPDPLRFFYSQLPDVGSRR